MLPHTQDFRYQQNDFKTNSMPGCVEFSNDLNRHKMAGSEPLNEEADPPITEARGVARYGR